MNITDVLTPGGLEGSKSNLMGKEGAIMNTDSLLFALFLQNFSGLSSQAAGQAFEESLSDHSVPGVMDFTGSILGQNFYQPIFQNLFPAGKEANSGSNGEQATNSFLLNNPMFNAGQQSICRALLEELLSKDSIGVLKAEGVTEAAGAAGAQEAAGMNQAAKGINLFAETYPVPTANEEAPAISGVNGSLQVMNLDSVQPQIDGNFISLDKQAESQAASGLQHQQYLQQQGNYGDVPAIQTIGLEGISDPEVKALDPVELEKYRTAAEQLRELSGKIELVKNQKAEDGGTTGKLSDGAVTNTMSDKQPISEKQPIHGHQITTEIQFSGRYSGTLNPAMTQDTEPVPPAETLSSPQTIAGAENEQEFSSEGEGRGKGFANSPNGQGGVPAQQPESEPDLEAQFLASKAGDIRSMEKAPANRELAEADQARVWDQVLAVLKKQDLRTQDLKELSLKLQPAELGQVNVSLRLENGLIHVTMNASEQATSLMLQNHLQDLRNGLAEMGVSCGNLELGYSQGNDQSGSGGENYPNAEQAAGQYLLEEENIAQAAVNWYAQLIGAGSRINVSA